jgi:hypothetical protein
MRTPPFSFSRRRSDEKGKLAGQKKEAWLFHHASSLLGTADSSTGLAHFFWFLSCVLRWRRGQAVPLAQPAAQIDEPAAGAAKGKVGQAGRAFPFEPLVADRATCSNHRTEDHSSGIFSLGFLGLGR